MRAVKLTTWERMTLLVCVPPNCPTADLPAFLRVMDILTLDEDEEEAVEFNEWRDAQGRKRTEWKNTKHLFDVEFSKTEWRTMIRLFRVRTTWPTMRETEVLLDKMEDAAATPIKKEKDEEEEKE